jgi:hypothetical protein
MFKSSLALGLLALSALGLLQDRRHPIVPLGQGTMQLESVAGGEAVIRIEAESEEQLERVDVRDPDGRLFLALDSSQASRRGLSGLVMELRETSLAEILASYSEGEYDFRATTVDGSVAVGKARLSFDLPATPRIVYPPAGALVPANGLTVMWLSDLNAIGYRLQLEQGENDGLAVNLPPGRNSFRVPDDFLPRGTEFQLELSAIGTNGNRTIVEVPFTTLP